MEPADIIAVLREASMKMHECEEIVHRLHHYTWKEFRLQDNEEFETERQRYLQLSDSQMRPLFMFIRYGRQAALQRANIQVRTFEAWPDQSEEFNSYIQDRHEERLAKNTLERESVQGMAMLLETDPALLYWGAMEEAKDNLKDTMMLKDRLTTILENVLADHGQTMDGQFCACGHVAQLVSFDYPGSSQGAKLGLCYSCLREAGRCTACGGEYDGGLSWCTSCEAYSESV